MFAAVFQLFVPAYRSVWGSSSSFPSLSACTVRTFHFSTSVSVKPYRTWGTRARSYTCTISDWEKTRCNLPYLYYNPKSNLNFIFLFYEKLNNTLAITKTMNHCCTFLVFHLCAASSLKPHVKTKPGELAAAAASSSK